MHLAYELQPWPLEFIEDPGVPLSYRVEDKMRLSRDKKELRVNPSLTLAAIPAEVYQYRLGNRSALECHRPVPAQGEQAQRHPMNADERR